MYDLFINVSASRPFNIKMVIICYFKNPVLFVSKHIQCEDHAIAKKQA